MMNFHLNYGLLMEKTDLSSYYKKPCRFKLKSGKEVFGVLWEIGNEDEKELCFASSNEYSDYIKNMEEKAEIANPFKLKMKLTDFIGVEPLNDDLPSWY